MSTETINNTNETNGLGVPRHYNPKDTDNMFAILLVASIGMYVTLTQTTLQNLNTQLQNLVKRQTEISNQITEQENAINKDPSNKAAKTMLDTLKNNLQTIQTQIQSLNARITSLTQAAATFGSLMNSDVTAQGQTSNQVAANFK